MKTSKAVYEQDMYPTFCEMRTGLDSIKNMKDADLYDLVIIDIQMCQHHELDALYDKLSLGFKLSPEERRQVEAFYLLTTMDFLVNA